MNLPSIKELKERAFLLFLLDIIFIIGPGIAVIFFFKRDLFFALDWIKLTLLSITIVTPFAFFNSAILYELVPTHKIAYKDEDFFFTNLSLAILMTGTMFYCFLYLAYFLI